MLCHYITGITEKEFGSVTNKELEFVPSHTQLHISGRYVAIQSVEQSNRLVYKNTLAEVLIA